jgi:hypothetical protein
MCQASSKSAEERDLWLEHALLSEIIILHPGHLTSDELALRMEDRNTTQVEVLNNLQALKHSGLVRFNGEMVEPTYAAVRAGAIFQYLDRP